MIQPNLPLTSDLEYTVQPSVAEHDPLEWDALAAGAHGDPLMTHDFTRAVEEGMRGEARFAHVILREGNSAVACASFCLLPVDLRLFTEGRVRQIAAHAGRLAPSWTLRRLLFCGLPVSVGSKAVAFARPDVAVRVLPVLHHIAVHLARRESADFIVFKEFTDGDRDSMDLLTTLGYFRFSSLPTNVMEGRFADFADYRGALRGHYRQNVRKSQEKSRAAGLRYERLTGTDSLRRAYTSEVHRLFEAVAGAAKHRLETLPISFFHSLARHLPGEVGLTAIYQGERIVAFMWNLLRKKSYYLLFAGVDYSLNSTCDLYFNLLYADMDYGFRAGAESLVFGQTADDLKLRLGCTQYGLSFYIAPLGLGGSLLLRWFGSRLFPERTLRIGKNVFAGQRPSGSDQPAAPTGGKA